MMSARNRHIKYCEVAKKSEWLENSGRKERFNLNTGKKDIIETDEWKIRMEWEYANFKKRNGDV